MYNAEDSDWLLSGPSIKAIADHTADEDIPNERTRLHYIEDTFPEVTTAADYLRISALIDVPERTECTPVELLDSATITELLNTAFTAYMDTLSERALFQQIDVETDRYQYEIMSPSKTMPVTTQDEFSSENLSESFETKTVKCSTRSISSRVGSYNQHRSIFEKLWKLTVELSNQYYETLPSTSTDDDGLATVINEAIYEITEAGFRPDIVVVPRGVDTSLDSIYGLDVIGSRWISGSDILVADSDHYGYETVFQEPRIRTSRPRQLSATPFDVFEINVDLGLSWIDVQPNAITRCTFNAVDINTHMVAQ